MTKYSTYRFLPELNLVICSYHGSINMNDIVQLTKNVFNDKEFNPEYDLFVDLKDCQGIAFRVDIMDYIDFSRKSLKLQKKIKTGIVVQSLNQEFLVNIYKGFGYLMNMEIEYFKRIDQYTEWMKYNHDQIGLLGETMESMKKEASEILI